MKNIFFLFTLLYFCINISGLAAHEDEFDKLIIKGKTLIKEGVQKWDDKIMLQARSLFERLLQNKEMQWLTHYYIGYADYRLAIFYQTKKQTALQLKYLNDGIDHLNSALEEKEEFADAHGLLSSLLGQKISTDPSLGMTLGMESAAALSDALEYGKTNPRVAMFSAISAFFTPEQWGGSKKKALAEMQRAAELFKNERLEDKRLPDWGHSEALAWLGQFYLGMDELVLAKESIEAALALDPHSGFAKMIQSQIQKKMTEK